MISDAKESLKADNLIKQPDSSPKTENSDD